MSMALAVREMERPARRLLRDVPARAVAILDSQNVCVVYLGEFEEAEVEALMALASRGLRAAGLLGRLLAGESLVAPIADAGDVVVHVTIAGRRLYLMLVFDDPRLADGVAGPVKEAIEDLERILNGLRVDPPAGTPTASGGGPGSGDAGLPVIELGVTPGLGRRGSN
jgi:hypothetical protein